MSTELILTDTQTSTILNTLYPNANADSLKQALVNHNIIDLTCGNQSPFGEVEDGVFSLNEFGDAYLCEKTKTQSVLIIPPCSSMEGSLSGAEINNLRLFFVDPNSLKNADGLFTLSSLDDVHLGNITHASLNASTFDATCGTLTTLNAINEEVYEPLDLSVQIDSTQKEVGTAKKSNQTVFESVIHDPLQSGTTRKQSVVALGATSIVHGFNSSEKVEEYCLIAPNATDISPVFGSLPQLKEVIFITPNATNIDMTFAFCENFEELKLFVEDPASAKVRVLVEENPLAVLTKVIDGINVLENVESLVIEYDPVESGIADFSNLNVWSDTVTIRITDTNHCLTGINMPNFTNCPNQVILESGVYTDFLLIPINYGTCAGLESVTIVK